MSNLADPAFSRGDLMRRLTVVEDRIRQLETARRLEAATIGRGGINVRGGSIVIVDAAGAETMRLSTTGLTLTGLLQVLGTIEVTGNSLIVLDSGGAEIFRAGSAGLSLRGVLDVLGSINVAGGGNITVTDGRLVARDGSGDVFRVDPGVPEIFMRKALLSDLVNEIVEELLTSPAGIVLAQFVNSQVFHFASDTGAGTVSSSSWSNLTGASVGPTCSGVQISSERRALVIVSALMTAAANERPHMSFAVSGASSFTPGTGFDDQFDLRLRTANQGFDARLSAVTPLGPSELTSAGTHTFTAKYRATIGTPSFSARTLAVIAY